MANKKLTGYQSLELVREIKSEPRFTMKEDLEKYDNRKETSTKKAKEPEEIIFSDVERLTKTIKKVKFEALKTEQKKKLISLLTSTKIIIDSFVSKIKDY